MSAMVVCTMPGCQTTAGCQCGRPGIPTIATATGKRALMLEPETVMRWRDEAIAEVAWLDHQMAELATVRGLVLMRVQSLDRALANHMPRTAAEAQSEALAAREAVARAEAMVADAVRGFDGGGPMVSRFR